MLIATKSQRADRRAFERTAAVLRTDLSDEMPERNSIATLLPIMAVVAIAFLNIGFLLPVLPLHVHLGLGLSTFVVGVVTGSQFLASLLSRVWAGQFADYRGPSAPSSWACWPLRGQAVGFRKRSSRRTRAAGRCRKLHHHWRSDMGPGRGRAPKRRASHRLGRYGDVRRDGSWRAGRYEPVRPRRICHCRGCDGNGSGSHAAVCYAASFSVRTPRQTG
jgi:hypothetical protein